MADDPLHDNPRSPKEADPRDFTEQFNTKLSKQDEAEYQKWAKGAGREKDTYDYDMRGAWKEGVTAGENGHFPDTYKKPNHPTFSDESQYHGKDGNEGGTWGKAGERHTFKPGKTNLKHFSPEELQDYFSKIEPDADLLDGG